MSETKPIAWMRRWKFENQQPPPKVKNAKGRWEWPNESKFLAVTPIKLFSDDIPLFALDGEAIRRVNCHETLVEALREILNSGIEFDDERLDYLSIQVDHEAWDQARQALTTAEEKPD